MKRAPLYATLFALLFLELALFGYLRIFGSRPELLLIATVFFGFNFGISRGAEVGFVSGVLKDLFSVTDFGVNTFSFLLVGILAGAIKNKVVKENFVTQAILSALFVYVTSGVYFFYLGEITGAQVDAIFWKTAFYKMLYTGCMAPFLFFILEAISGNKKVPIG